MRRFQGSFTQQEPFPDEALINAADVLAGGRLHRYGAAPGEDPEAALLEQDYAHWQGADFCLATASGGQALQIALRSVGVQHGNSVLTNAFTLAPVPGSIAAVGGVPTLIETTEDLVIDVADLERKARESSAKVLMLSHMRGHLADMAAIQEICSAHNITMIDDCAHTMGAWFGNRRSGNHGQIACFSSQTYKHINSGEGGLLTTSDPDIAARATILSGSYMNYERHGAGPDASHFANARYEMPNMSARMDNLRAAILRPQIASLDANVARWNARHTILERALSASNTVVLPRTQPEALRVGSSFQFRVPDLSYEGCSDIVRRAAELGVELKWFGASEPKGFTSNHTSWRYAPSQKLPETDRILSTLFDMRVPLTFSEEDCQHIGEILQSVTSTS